jgi:hypothetical protein
MYNVDFGGHVRKVSKSSCKAGGVYDNGQYINISYNSDRGIYEAKVNGEFPNYGYSPSSSDKPIPGGVMNNLFDSPSSEQSFNQEERIKILRQQAEMLRSQGSDNLISEARKKASELRSQRSSSSDQSFDQAERIKILQQQAEMLRNMERDKNK